MNLYIIRHAKASHEDFFPGDIYRTLDKKGYSESLAQAQKLDSIIVSRPDHIITSPAIRAFTTALLFSNQLNFDNRRINLNPAIYEADYLHLLRIINSIDNKFKNVLLFGHNPGLTDLINYVCGPVLSSIPTAGIASLRFSTDAWHDIDAGKGKLEATYFP